MGEASPELLKALRDCESRLSNEIKSVWSELSKQRDSLHKMEVSVSQRLTRIETMQQRIEDGQQEQTEKFTAHATDDTQNFQALRSDVHTISIDHQIAKKAGERAGTKWGSAVAAILIGLYEVIRYFTHR